MIQSKQLNSGPGTVTAATVSLARRVQGAPLPGLELSSDGGATWQVALPGTPSAFAVPGGDLRMRLTLTASPRPGTTQLVHDVTVSYDWTSNQMPTAPTLTAPAAGAATTVVAPTFDATFNDPDVGDAGVLEFEVCSILVLPVQTCAGAGGVVVASGMSGSGIAPGATGTWQPPALSVVTTYYWRARSRDSELFVSPWSAGRALTIDATLTVSSTQPGVLVVGSGSDATVQSTATVTSTHPSGYQLQVAHDDAVGMACTGAGCGSDVIPDWGGTLGAPTVWAPGITGSAGWFGMTVVDVNGVPGARLAAWTSGNGYAGLSATPGTVHQTTGPAAGDTIRMQWRLAASTGATPTKAGSYETVEILTVVPNV